jgi:bifunctional non-homologous end joining protein LigD
MTTVSADGREIRLTSLDRVLWPRTHTTKLDLVQYLVDVSVPLLAHLRGRPIALRRFPNGVDGRGWYQVRAANVPPWLPTSVAPGTDGPVELCLIEDRAALAWAGNQSALELHPYPWLAADHDHPDQLVFDLDPGPPAAGAEACRVACALRAVLDALELEAVPKVSGAAGVHLVVPIEPRYSFAATKAFARLVASLLAQDEPQLVVVRQGRRARVGKVFVDWLQNDRWRSLVAPYSPRACPLPTVAAPVTWAELEHVGSGRRPPETLVFTLDDVRRRLDRHGDLAAGLLGPQQPLPERFLTGGGS